MTWSPTPEMMWKSDPEIEAIRKVPAWGKFHRECGKVMLYYDHIERVGGKRSDYAAVAFTLGGKERLTPTKVAEGRGKTVAAALNDAFLGAQQQGFSAPEAQPWMDLLLAPVAAAPAAAPEPVADEGEIDLEDLLG